MIIYLSVFSSLFPFSDIERKVLEKIKKNSEFFCEYNEKTVTLTGENFIGNYYNQAPYGLWKLKNENIKQCFLSNERNFYYFKDKYYIADNKMYYLKIDYKENIYICQEKTRKKKTYVFQKINGKYIRKDIPVEITVPKPLYDFLSLEIKGKLLKSFPVDEIDF